jgi:hypothetical protein
VRRTGGISETPDSSRKQIQAPRLSAPFDPGPLLGAPAGDLGLVPLTGAAGGPLRAPAEPAQQPPHVPGVVAHPGELLDHRGDPRQRPQLGVEPECLRSLAQRLFDRVQFRRRQPWPAAGAARPAQRRLAALAPAAIPNAGRLGGDPEGAGDLGLGGAVGEHAGGFQAPLLQAGEVPPPGARLDRGGLLVGLGSHTHASSVPVPIAVLQPNKRSSFNYDSIIETLLEYASGPTSARSPRGRPGWMRVAPLSDETLTWSFWNWRRPLGYGVKFSEVQLEVTGFKETYAPGAVYYAHPKNRLYESSIVVKPHGSLKFLTGIATQMY